MKSWSIFLRLIGFIILISLFSLSLAVTGFSGQEAGGPPKVRLTILMVPEKEACKPSGFRSYDGEKADCALLTLEDLDTWEKAGFRRMTAQMPPAQISLPGAILEFLETYRSAPKNTPEQRYAAVFVFEWDKLQNTAVSLERKVDQEYSNINAMKWHGSLNNEKYWIHQERADALLPMLNTKWILRLGANSWTFHFR